MTQADSDRNLLFGVLALQDDLIGDRQFTDACALWALHPDKSLADVLVERGWISPAHRAQVEERVARKLKKHGGDPHASLGEVAGAEVRDTIRQIDSTLIRETLQRLPPAPGFVRVETLDNPAASEHRSRYTLSRVHAQGGIGKVWVARDTDLNRDVALKEIRADRTVYAEASGRFLKEAQVTGQLEHPNIVPVYELGRRPEDGQPFYTMRFVRGRTLRDAIAAHHQDVANGRGNALGMQKLLNAFVSICQALGYAHQKGVIHRDLKPDNIVMGAFGEVVVLDWGLAKLVDQPDEETTDIAQMMLSHDAKLRSTMGVVGTPAYMAPEQAEGRQELVDARTDVYGLGGILYEILTNHVPAEGATIQEVLQRVITRDAPHPRDAVSSVPRALDAICTKALEKSRADRYQKATDLAEDVQRWLADEPVSVYRDPPLARFFRWARRHRTLVASLAALVTTTVAGLTIGLVVVNHERERTAEQRNLAVSNADQALKNLRLAQGAADELLAEVADVDLADIPQMESVRRRLLEKAQAGYRQFLEQKGNDPLIRWGASRALVRVGDIQALLGDAPKAEASYNRSIDMLGALAKTDPRNVEYQRDLSRAEHGLGVLLKDASRLEPAEARLRTAVAMRTELAKGANPRPDDLQALAESRYQLGALLARKGAGRSADAEAYQGALDAVQDLAKQYADRPEYRVKLARYRNNYGMLQRALGHPKDAEVTFREVLDLLAPLLEGPSPLPGPRWQTARAANNLGTLLIELKRLGDARKEFITARDRLKTLAAEFPAVAQYQQDLAALSYNFGLLEQQSGHLNEAMAAFDDSAQLLEQLCRRYPQTPVYRLKLAATYVAKSGLLVRSNTGEALTELKKSLKEQTALLDEFPDVPEYQIELARTHYNMGYQLFPNDPAQALSHAEVADALYRKALEKRPRSEVVLRELVENGVVRVFGLLKAHRYADARAVVEETLKTASDNDLTPLHSASLLARCADGASTAEDGKKFAEECRVRAVNILIDAVRRKQLRDARLLDDPGFHSLSGRPDFQKLRAALAQPAQAG